MQYIYMLGDSININVKIIDGRGSQDGVSGGPSALVLPLSIPPAIEPDVRNAGIELQSTISTYVDRYNQNLSNIPNGGFLAMAALDVAYRFEVSKKQNDYSNLLNRLNNLNTELENLLSSF